MLILPISFHLSPMFATMPVIIIYVTNPLTEPKARIVTSKISVMPRTTLWSSLPKYIKSIPELPEFKAEYEEYCLIQSNKIAANSINHTKLQETECDHI